MGFALIAIPWLGALIALAMFLLVNLSGATSSLSFLQQLYLSKVDGYFWTLYNFCRTDSTEIVCTPNFAAYPYAPYRIDSDIINQGAYYYLLRVAYGFLVGALAFTFFANVIAMFCFCLKSSTPYRWFEISLWAAYWVGLIGVAIETGIHVSGTRALSALNDALLGVRMFVFMWVGVGLLFFAVLILTCSPSPEPIHRSSKEQYRDSYNQGYQPYYEDGYYGQQGYGQHGRGQQGYGPQYQQQGYLEGHVPQPQRFNG